MGLLTEHYHHTEDNVYGQLTGCLIPEIFSLNIRNCWKVWNNLCGGSPVWQISSDVWARSKFLDLLAPRRGHRGGISQSLFKDERRIDIVNGRRSFNTSNFEFFQRSNPSNIINILPAAIMNDTGSPATDVTQWSRHVLKPFRSQKSVWLT